MFQRIVDLCRNLVGQPAHPLGTDGDVVQDDRRVWVRYPSEAQTTVKPADETGDARRSAQVRDVSRGGINVLLDRQYAPGELVSIDLPGGPPGTTDTILACVVHVTPQGEGRWATGCIFCEELHDDELSAFGARRLQAPADDNRGYVRFPCAVKATYQRIDDPTNETIPAEVEDISPTGIRLVLERPLTPGSLLSLHLRNATGVETRTVLACVVHVMARPANRSVMGCTFIRELSASDLKALL